MLKNKKNVASTEYVKSLLNAAIESIDKKLNSKKANWNQNDKTAIDYIKNRTHYTEIGEITTNVLEWDGSAEGLLVIKPVPEIGLYKVSDVVLEDSDLVGAIVTFMEMGELFPEEVFEESIVKPTDQITLIFNTSLIIVKEANAEFQGVIFPEVGMYFMKNGPVYPTKLEITSGATPFKMIGEIVHKIDKKYLPEISSIKNILDGRAEGSVKTIGAYDEIGGYAFAEGGGTTASGTASHAEGIETESSGTASHAEGSGTWANGVASHAEGLATIANGHYQHVEGRNNIVDNENRYLHIAGNGVASNDETRSNAHTLDWNGNAWFAGNIYIGGKNQDDINSSRVITEKEFISSKDHFALIDIDNGYTYIVQIKSGNLVSRCSVSNIEVTTMPNKTEYYAGEYFNPTGMVITGVCRDGSIIEITNYTLSDNKLIIGENIITISYTEAGITCSTTIIVNAIKFDAATMLVDFYYNANADGTYTITGWK